MAGSTSSPSNSSRRFPFSGIGRNTLLMVIFAVVFFLLSIALIRLFLEQWAPLASFMLTVGATALLLALRFPLSSEDETQRKAGMRRTDRLSMLGTLTAGLAHEIRNPLVSIKTYFQLLPERYDDREFRERFQKVASNEVDRISRLVEELLEFARPVTPKFRPVHIHALLDEVITLLDATAGERQVDLKREYDPEAPAEIVCDPEQIKQVLLNIAHNAFDAVNGSGRIVFRTRSSGPMDGMGLFLIEIEDNGIGMTDEEMSQLFTPFYTTKSSGTGLGLAISRRIIEDHLGTITLTSRRDQGSTFCLQLPRNPDLHERRKGRSSLSYSDQKDMVR
jgi:signal transduction histidine kinase